RPRRPGPSPSTPPPGIDPYPHLRQHAPGPDVYTLRAKVRAGERALAGGHAVAQPWKALARRVTTLGQCRRTGSSWAVIPLTRPGSGRRLARCARPPGGG